MKSLSLKPVLLIFILLLGLAVSCSKAPAPSASGVDYYTCTMHPSVHSRDPGKCPICSMDLVPVMKKTAAAGASPATNDSEIREFSVPVERQQQIGVTYATVTNRVLSRTIPASGIVDALPGDAKTSAGSSPLTVTATLSVADAGPLHPGQPIDVTSAASQGHTFAGKLLSVDPTIDPPTQSERIRVVVDNPDLLLRPGLAVDLEIHGDPVTGLAIPVDAVKPTGLHNLVFVDRGGGKLEPRFVTLGGRFGDFYLVPKGLRPGERVVRSANFLIDAESKIQGAVKDFNPTEEAQ